jgi:hypothetical protein
VKAFVATFGGHDIGVGCAAQQHEVLGWRRDVNAEWSSRGLQTLVAPRGNAASSSGKPVANLTSKDIIRIEVSRYARDSKLRQPPAQNSDGSRCAADDNREGGAMSENREGAPLSAVAADNQGAPTSAHPPGTFARDFLVNLEHALEEIVTLKIVTLIGQVSVAGEGTKASVGIAGQAQPEAASTQIDLLTGHITNTFSTGFAALANGEMRNFHQSQVEKSQSIVMGNLAEVQKLATALLGAVRR